MGEMDGPTIAKELPALERERVEDFLRRPGGALVLTRLLLPDELAIELPAVGSLLLRPGCSAIEAESLAGLVASCEVFSLDAMDGGVLLVERTFARDLVNAMVGLPASLVDQPLSRIERGMLAGLAARSLAKSRFPFGIRASAGVGLPRMEDALCIRVGAQLNGSSGQAWLCASGATVRRAWMLGISSATLASPRMELAQTQLTRAEAMAACPEDLVVFDDSPAPPTSAPLSVQIRFRSKCLPARLDRDGRVRTEEAATRRVRPAATHSLLPADFVEVTAEIARTADASTTADPRAGADWVLLRTGESDWAEGVLTAYRDRLAVRISRILTRPCAG